jgi:hypothetical protein
MESATFREWLAQRGCRFDSHDQKGRSQGHPVLMVHREGRTAALPLLGHGQHLSPEVIRGICGALGLDDSELPGPKSRA